MPVSGCCAAAEVIAAAGSKKRVTKRIIGALNCSSAGRSERAADRSNKCLL
jgi:hypothetical protein